MTRLFAVHLFKGCRPLPPTPSTHFDIAGSIDDKHKTLGSSPLGLRGWRPVETSDV